MEDRATIMLWGLLLLLAAALPGCLKLTQSVTVMPDGSGKIDLRFGLSDELVKQAEADDQDPFREVLPLAMKDKTRGIIAFTPPQREQQEGFHFVGYTMYFRDINAVKIDGLGEDETTEYRYTREGESATLTVIQGPAIAKLADYEAVPEAERDELGDEALAGLSFTEHFTLPGEVNPIDGVQTRGNTATLVVTHDHLIHGTGPVTELKGKTQLTFEIPKVSVDREAVAAFNQAMREAIESWRIERDAAE